MNKYITKDIVVEHKDKSLPHRIGEVVNDYFLHGETPLAIAYRQRKGQEECGRVFNFKDNNYDRL